MLNTILSGEHVFQHGQTALHWAVSHGDPELLSLLIAHDVDIEAHDKVLLRCTTI
jgi:ankyrin repeat protein